MTPRRGWFRLASAPRAACAAPRGSPANDPKSNPPPHHLPLLHRYRRIPFRPQAARLARPPRFIPQPVSICRRPRAKLMFVIGHHDAPERKRLGAIAAGTDDRPAFRGARSRHGSRRLAATRPRIVERREPRGLCPFGDPPPRFDISSFEAAQVRSDPVPGRDNPAGNVTRASRGDYARSQFSICRLSTRENSCSLSVTTMHPSASAWRDQEIVRPDDPPGLFETSAQLTIHSVGGRLERHHAEGAQDLI